MARPAELPENGGEAFAVSKLGRESVRRHRAAPTKRLRFARAHRAVVRVAAEATARFGEWIIRISAHSTPVRGRALDRGPAGAP